MCSAAKNMSPRVLKDAEHSVIGGVSGPDDTFAAFPGQCTGWLLEQNTCSEENNYEKNNFEITVATIMISPGRELNTIFFDCTDDEILLHIEN